MSEIINTFHEICKREKNRISFVYLEKGKLKTKTFLELKKDTDIMMNCLSDMGVKSKDKILAFATSSYQLCVFMLASLRLGASIMYVDIWAKQDRLKNAFNDYRPDYVLVSNKTKYLKIFFREINHIKKVINIDSVNYGKTSQNMQPEIGDDQIALLTMTTGSTGKPKTAIRTHKHLYEQLKLVNDNIDSKTNREIVLTTSYIYVFANIMNGYTTVLPQINLSLSSKYFINKKLLKFRNIPISMIITSPDFCLKTDNIYHKLRKLYFGGAILNINEAKNIQNKYNGVDVEYIYGATECNLISKVNLNQYIHALEKESKAVLGQVVKGVKVKIGTENEILVSSKALLEDYLVQDKTNKILDADNTIWHNTGDAGCYENGILYYYGRNKYYIKNGTHKIYSSQIEQGVTNNFRKIDKCAVIQKGNAVCLYIQTKKDIDYNEIKIYLKKRFHISRINIYKIKKIPCDVKYHTKINYSKLLTKKR